MVMQERNALSVIAGMSLLTAMPVLGANCQNPTPVWQDEFSGNALDTTKWEVMIGDGCSYGICGWGNNELQSYQEGNLQVSNGTLKIVAKKERVKGSQYTSGRIRTANMPNGGEWTHGRFEASMKLPTGTGMWPAFWMLPTDPAESWPISGEIDILEATGQADMIAFGTIHYGQLYPDNEWTSGRIIKQPDRWSDGFHEYAVEWEPGEIRWYVDDILYSVKTPDDLSDPAYWTFDNYSYHFLLNMAVGGSIGGPVDDSMLPQTMEVDYVRAYDFGQPSLTGPHIVTPNSSASYAIVDEAGTGSSYQWSSPTGDSSTSDTITVNWQTAGGQVVADITNSCGTYQAAMDVHVLPVQSEQTKLDGFEGSSQVTYTSFSGLFTQSVANPSPDSVNGTASVAEYQRDGGSFYDVIAMQTAAVPDVTPFISGENAFYLDVYMPQPVERELLIQLEDSNVATPDNYPSGRHSKYIAHTEAVAGWQRLRFELEDRVDGTTGAGDVDSIILLIAPNTTTSDLYYLDNLSIYAPDGGTDPEPVATSMSVDMVSTSTVSAGKGKKRGQATVNVVDDTGAPVENATVSGTFSGSWNESASAVTNAQGQAIVQTSTALSGTVSVSFCVSDLQGTLTHDTSASNGLCQ